MPQLPAALSARYRAATSHEVRSWSYGMLTAVRNPQATTWQERRGTLDDQRIFGPVRDFECACGKYRGPRHEGMICDRCGVKVGLTYLRRTRFGHVDLPGPVPHPLAAGAEPLAAFPVLPAVFHEAETWGRLAEGYDDLIRASRSEDAAGCVSAVEALVGLMLPLVATGGKVDLPRAGVDTLARGLALELRDGTPDGRCIRCGYPLAGLTVTSCPGCGRETGKG
jgi:hypothetical protein